MSAFNRMVREHVVSMRTRPIKVFSRAFVMVLIVVLVLPSVLANIDVSSSTEQGPTGTSTDTPIYLYFRAATFDPLWESPSLPEDLMSDGTNGQYIIQLKGPVYDNEKEQMVSEGATLLGYVPDYAFMAEMSQGGFERVKALPFVRAVVPFHPAYKLDPALWSKTGNIQVRIDIHRDLELVFLHILDVGGTVDYVWDNGLQAVVPGESLPELAALGPVDWIEQVPTWHLSNDVAAGIMNVNTTWNTYHLNGSGQIVAVADTGLDTGVNNASMHADFQGRIISIIDKWPGGDGANDTISGHGTHVAGSVLGTGVKSNGKIKGIAYGAKLYFQALEKNSNGQVGTGSPLDSWLFQPAYDAGARVHTNSWGSNINTGNYSSSSRDVDKMVWNNDDLVILYAAGNSGKDTNNDGIVDLGEVDAPATAKNCIAVGASESLRKSMGWGYSPTTFSTAPIKNDNAADNPNGMAAFSSRGPANDSRVKPDLVAPGTGILSTRSSKASETGWGLPTTEADKTYYMYMGGTSMATPLVAGAAAVVRQYYISNMSYNTPSAALVKATLINGAYDMPGQYASPKNDTGPVWDYNQGWGRVNLTNSLFPPLRNIYFEDKVHALTTGQNVTYDINVTGNLPFRVTLVWTDPPALASVYHPLVNNLDLTLIAPNGTVYKGNKFNKGESIAGGAFDSINNVENIFFKTPVLGKWKIRVNATNIPTGPQKYALVFTGVFSSLPPHYPTLNSPASGVYTSARPTFNVTTNNYNTNKIQYQIELSKDNFNTIYRIYNQTTDSSGWDKLKYNSGENATYTVKVGEELTDNVKYYWRAFAYDGNWSTSSDVRDFTVDAKPPTALSITINSGKNATNSRSVTLTVSATDNRAGMFSGMSGMSFSNDGLSWSAWESYTNSKAWTLEDFQGLHRVYFRPRDAVGNVADPASSTIIYDNVAPNGLLLTVDSGAAYSRDDKVNLTLSASDTTSGVLLMSFSNDGTKWGPWENFASSKKDWNITDPANGGTNAEGKKTIWFRANDTAGNVAPKVSSVITYDKTSPQGGSIVINGGDLYTTTRLVNVYISGTDTISGVADMAIDMGQGFGPWEPYVSSKFIVLPTNNGPKNVKIRLKDVAGNTGQPFQGTIYYDDTPPGLMTITPAQNITNILQVNLKMTANDTGSGLKDMSFSFDGQLWTSWEVWSPTKLLTLPPGDGTKSIYLRARDNAGNIGGPVRASLMLDTEPPMATVTVNSGASYMNNSTVQLAFSLLGLTDLTGYEVSMSNDGTTWSTYQPLTGSVPWTMLPGDGDKKVRANIRDPAGNLAQIESTIIILDTTAPDQMSLEINDGADFAASALVHLSLKAHDGSGTSFMAFSSDGTTWGPWETFAAKADLELPNGVGERTVQVKVMDRAGNVASTLAKIILDESPPEIYYLRINNVSEESMASSVKTNIGYTISAHDFGSNISEMSFGFNGLTWGPWTAYKVKGNIIIPAVQGVQTVYVRLRDRAGNIGNLSSTMVLLDSQPPEAVSVMLNNGEATTDQSQVILRISAVDTISGLDSFRFKEGDLAWSAWLPFMTSRTIKLTDTVGEKKVYVEIRDRAGNVATQAMASITLEDVKPPTLSVRFTSPSGGQTVQGSVNIKVEVSGGTARYLYLRVDGGYWVKCDVAGDTSCIWDTKGVRDGPHVIEVKASNGAEDFVSGPMAITVQNTQKTGGTFGDVSTMSLILIIIIVVIVSAIVGAGVAYAMRPKRPPVVPEREPEEMPRARSSRGQERMDGPRDGRRTKGRSSGCTYCGYAIEPNDHYITCAQCGEMFHDDCAHAIEGYCSKCGGPLY